jgi:predicted nucleic acid-binding Zn ribbon protein
MEKPLNRGGKNDGDARSRALAAWRGVDCRETEGAWKVMAKATSDLVPKVLSSLNVEQRVAESQIVKVWNQVIDPTIAAHAQPAGLTRGTLFVNVDSNVWLSEILRYRRTEILERIRHVVGATMVQKISFRVGG